MNPAALPSLVSAALALLMAVWLYVDNGSALTLQAQWLSEQQAVGRQQAAVQTAQQTLQNQQAVMQATAQIQTQQGPSIQAMLQELSQRAAKSEDKKLHEFVEKYLGPGPGAGAAQPPATPAPAPSAPATP